MRAGNKLVVRNVGLMLSGKLEQPILDADCIVTLDGKITAIGYEKDLDVSEASQTIDAKGSLNEEISAKYGRLYFVSSCICLSFATSSIFRR